MDPEKTDFTKAVNDYFYLINRKYPDKGSLKLIGDRYRLSGTERMMLYRGVNSRLQIADRRARLVPKPSGSLVIDAYNALFTLLNYRLGNTVPITL